MAQSRQYDVVVFGATGHTGKLTAEHITASLPTDLKWAIAGRSSAKLEAVAEELKSINADRIQPGIEVCNLNDSDLTALAKRTKVLISTVGPYALYGEHAFKACAENGTHYLDVTGEVPYVRDMIQKYGNTAKSNGSIMIPQIGIESAPSDLITWTLVEMVKKRFSAPTREVIVSVHEMRAAPSGGTLASVLGIFDVYSLKQLHAAHAPYAISPTPGPKIPNPKSWVTKLFGVNSVRDLGILTTSIGGMANAPIVQRSWGILGGSNNYGPRFSYSEYAKARNYLTAVGSHFAIAAISLLLAIPFVRRLAKRFVYQPGEGPTKEQCKNDRIEYRAIGMPDVETSKPARAYVRAHFEGSLYKLTGILLAEAAISILKDGHKLSGDVYTPACLGQKFIDRLDTAGFKFETRFFEN